MEAEGFYTRLDLLSNSKRMVTLFLTLEFTTNVPCYQKVFLQNVNVIQTYCFDHDWYQTYFWKTIWKTDISIVWEITHSLVPLLQTSLSHCILSLACHFSPCVSVLSLSFWWLSEPLTAVNHSPQSYLDLLLSYFQLVGVSDFCFRLYITLIMPNIKTNFSRKVSVSFQKCWENEILNVLW